MASEKITVHDKVFDLLLSQSEIEARIDQLSVLINEHYREQCPIFLMVLNGAFMFGTELVKRFQGPCEVSFLRAKSYVGMASSGSVQVDGQLSPIKNRPVLLIEDIVDSGTTLAKLMPMLRDENPISLRLASLLFKPAALQHDLKVDYCGFEIPNRFVVGYGLDYNQLGRNYPAIYVLEG
ncbi:MAG: hypoxanthine phosphoribosyltransferase [Bacteroidota bacterium]